MKKVFYIVLGVILAAFTSCMKTDNWDEPDVRVYGRIIDSYTGENILSSQDEWGIRIWERTWTESVPNHQTLSVKQDGSYNNSKLFAGTYDMLPYGGPFWPVDTVKNVMFDGNTEQDFTVTPYLQLTDFEASLNGLKLTLRCRLKAPRRQGLPNLVEIKPFLSLTTFCGATNYIDIGEYNNMRKQINRSWIEEVGDVETSNLYRIGPLPVKAGYTYYVRLGANVNDANRKYNYSEIIKVEVPADAQNDPNEVPDTISAMLNGHSAVLNGMVTAGETYPEDGSPTKRCVAGGAVSMVVMTAVGKARPTISRASDLNAGVKVKLLS
jgi:hypothetical protein